VISRKNVFLFLTDKWSEIVWSNFHHLWAGTKAFGEAYVLFHQKSDILPEPLADLPVFVFTYESLVKMNYLPISGTLIPGSNHFPVLEFFLSNPVYDYYWFVEDDVWFNGDWNDFFGFFHFIDHDFVSSHLRCYSQEPRWPWWGTLRHPKVNIPPDNRIRSFNPAYRISRAALAFINRSLSDYWIGHHEVLLPTLLHHGGFSISDFGGCGEFVIKGNENRFYTSGGPDATGRLADGTMRYRPLWEKEGMEKNKLYHPVKGNLLI
jgi:hypothetical protein